MKPLLKKLRLLLRLTPTACLLLALALFLLSRTDPFRGVLWYGRNAILFSAQPRSFYLILSHDADPYPVTARTPYLRLWTYDNNYHYDQFGGNGPPFLPPSDIFDNYFSTVNEIDQDPASPAYRFKGAWITSNNIESLDRNVLAAVPWWMLFTVLSIPIALQTLPFVIRAFKRRHRPGLCPNCSYDLRASANRCPECGHPIDASVFRVKRSRISPIRLASRANIHIRRHALAILALAALAAFFIADSSRPIRPVLATMDWNQLQPELNPEAQANQAADLPVRIHYNIVDLCQPDSDGNPEILPNLWSQISTLAPRPENLEPRGTTIDANLTPEHHRQLITILNRYRREHP